ncbi:MAG TPA: hypothetical protein VJ276_11930 [Thermoanaerobaculia bacterium]|nr:hypothetical protein [Thermoanaerobaculia bacterium]
MRLIPAILAAALFALPVLAAEKAQEPTVTIDVKDAELRPLLKVMQRQCGIRNLVIDRDVQGSGATFLFREVPCRQAFDVVFKTFGLAAVHYENDVVHVSRRK